MLKEFKDLFKDGFVISELTDSVGTNGEIAKVLTEKWTGQGFLYNASSSQNNQDNRTFTDSSHILLLDPANVSVTIANKDVLTYKGLTYDITFAQDIADQGEVLQVELQIKE